MNQVSGAKMKLVSGTKVMGEATVQDWLQCAKYEYIWHKGEQCRVLGHPDRVLIEGTTESHSVTCWLFEYLREDFLDAYVVAKKMYRVELFPPCPTELTPEQWLEKLPPSSEGYPNVVYVDDAKEVKAWAARNSVAYSIKQVDMTCITIKDFEEEEDSEDLHLVDADTNEYVRDATVEEWIASAKQSLYDEGQGVITVEGRN